jgi:hypothetical protein
MELSTVGELVQYLLQFPQDQRVLKSEMGTKIYSDIVATLPPIYGVVELFGKVGGEAVPLGFTDPPEGGGALFQAVII